MSDLSPIQQQVKNRELSEEAARLKAEAEKQQAQDAWKKLDALIKGEEFPWYVENVLVPMVTEELGKAIDISKSKDERSDAAQRHDFGQDILKAAETKRAFWAQKGEIIT